jgi:Zn-dependent oligopeptidase
VYSADLFATFKKAGLGNKELGKKYRKEILEPGRSRDAMDSIVAFLGRKPSTEPFFKFLGLE